MTNYEYKIRCKICKLGFTPLNRQMVFHKICSKCLLKYKNNIKEDKK